MGGGVVSGLIWGAVVSVVILAALSLSMPLPERMTQPMAAPTAETETETETQASAPEPVSEPDPMPEPAAAPVPPALPDSPPQTPQAPLRIDPAPRLPQIETPPAATAAPPAMDAAASDQAPARAVEDPATPPSVFVAVTPEQPEIAVLPVAPSPQFGTPSEASAGGTAPRRLAVLPPEDRLTPIDTAPPPAAMPAPALDPVAAPDTDPAPAAQAVLPQVAPPTPPAVEAAPGISPRLPQATTPPDAPTRAPPTVDAQAADPQPAATGALAQNAVPFAAAPDQPILSVILIEDQSNPLEPALLSQISFPVSFALDPVQPGAQARAALLHAAGFEVVILGAGAIPTGATPADVEVALAAARATLPQAVALIDDPASRIQGDRPVLEATVAALADSGHGLIAYARGLNAAETSARRAGVAAATAFRLLDDEDQRAPVITRYLDRAGFAAGQQGGVVVVGRIRPDTITALFSWALSGRSEGVRLAPVSAVLMRLND